MPAARPTHGAVSRGTGSAMMFSAGRSGSCARVASAWSAPVTIKIRSRGHQGLDPRHRLLEHRRLAGEAEQLLGPVAAALGPESGPAAAGHDDRV